MRKIAIIVLSLIFIASLCFLMTACDNDRSGKTENNSEAGLLSDGDGSAGGNPSSQGGNHSAHAHKGEWRVVTAPTCATEGLRQYVCTECGEILQTEAIKPTGEHTPGDWITVSVADCGHEGLRQKVCSVCGAVVEEDVTPASGEHTEGDWETVTEVNCGTDGERRLVCAVCGEVINTEITPATGDHDYVSSITKQPAFEEEGIMHYECSVCGASYDEAIPALTYRPEDVWDGGMADSYAEGDGTSSAPYIINTAAQLRYFAKQVSGGEYYSGKYFKLGSDIVLNDVSNWTEWSETNAPANVWDPVGYVGYGYNPYEFKGTFDGDGKTIRGVYVNVKYKYNSGVSAYGGLFGTIQNATVKNVNVSESFIYSETMAGGVIGGCTQSKNSSNIEDCSFSGVVKAKTFAGGIIGYESIGSRQGMSNVYGGYVYVRRCVNNGKIVATGSDSAAGGIVGIVKAYAGLTLCDGCVNYGAIVSSGAAGGVMGREQSNDTANPALGVYIRNSHNEGSVTTTGEYAGGIISSVSLYQGVNDTNYVEIKNCYNTAKIVAKKYVGGLAGVVATSNTSDTKVINCYNTGAVEATEAAGEEGSYYASYVGGLIGDFSVNRNTTNKTVSNSFNSGSVKGGYYVGGLIGYNSSGYVLSCYNAGEVNGAVYVGGMVGVSTNYTSIDNVYNVGSISGTERVGGLVGDISGTLNHSFNIGSVSGNVSVGAGLGYNDGSVSNTYYLENVAVNSEGTYQGLSGVLESGRSYDNYYFKENAMGSTSTYKQFVFSGSSAYWQMSEENGKTYPHLRNVATEVSA